jgi:hypothetical protein
MMMPKSIVDSISHITVTHSARRAITPSPVGKSPLDLKENIDQGYDKHCNNDYFLNIHTQ